jgi:hypothetical protein
MYQPEAYSNALLFRAQAELRSVWSTFFSCKLISAMFIFLLLGLGSIAIAPTVTG